MTGTAARFLLAIVAMGAMLSAAPAVAQVAEAQRLLNAMSLEAGPVDGAAGPATIKAWQAFLSHRGLPLDTPITAETIKELRGITNPPMPKASGMRFETVGRGFVGTHSYRLFDDDPTKFCVTVQKGDYDPVSYRDSGSAMERQYGFPLRKQRAELLDTTTRRNDRSYTVDFDVMVDSWAAGIILQVHRGGSGGGMNLSTNSQAIVLTAGGQLENVSVLRGDYVGKWHAFRLVFYPAGDGQSWFRIYVDGSLALDTSDRNPRYPMASANLHFGLYRGQVQEPATACYRNIRLSQGDLGAP